MDRPDIHQDSPAWIFFVHVAFAVSVTLTGIGIYLLPVDLWIKGYFAMGLFFTIGSTITLTKTLRDAHEGRKLINRLTEVKTEKLLQDYEMRG
jgi:hypothetical protein